MHDLDMSRFLMGTEPESILAFGSCHIDARIQELPGAEAFDTATIVVKYAGGKTATIDVCRQVRALRVELGLCARVAGANITIPLYKPFLQAPSG